MRLGGWLGSFLLAVGCVAPCAAAAPCDGSTKPPAETDAEAAPSWCAPELEVLPGEVCHFSPQTKSGDPPSTLVIYLHGVIQPGTEWQWTQERAMVRQAKVHGLTALVPRGRRGIGPKGMRDWWTWPTSSRAQGEVEDELVAEWMAAKALLEARHGRPFEKTYVFGFSNGAYYGAALALRGRLKVDGYALFAGSGGSYLKHHGKRVTERPPIYVGYGKKDRAASHDSYQLGMTLRSLGWPYKLVGRRRVGHSMTDAQVSEALAFLGRPR